MWAMRGAGKWSEQRRSNLLDGAAPFYDTYRCKDGRFLAVAAIERKFYSELLVGLDITDDLGDQYDRGAWPLIREKISVAVTKRTRDEWADAFAGSDACASPVLTFSEALQQAHATARKQFIELDGVAQAAPAPRFSRTPASLPSPPASRSTAPADVLRDWT
jgi:alpha-methylacyl-CoA racemase